MHNCIAILGLTAALSTSLVNGVSANSLTLISCASGSYRAYLDGIRPGVEAAGVVMIDGPHARRRAELVTTSSVERMIAPGDDNAIVLVTKPPLRIERDDTACVIFTGTVDDEPLPPTKWSAQGRR